MNHFAVDADFCYPFPTIPEGSQDSRFAARHGLLLIFNINSSWNLAKVFPSIVRSLSVDVVHVVRRKRPGHAEMRETSGSVISPVKGDLDIPILIERPRRAPAPILQVSIEKTCLRVVGDQFTQALRSHFFRHFGFTAVMSVPTFYAT